MKIKFINALSHIRTRSKIGIMSTAMFLVYTTVFGFTSANSFSRLRITINWDNDKNSSKLIINNNQESIEISGIITDQGGQPLPGASILEKGTLNGTQSDFNGKFSLKVKSEKAILIVSFVGFLAKEISVKSKIYFNIVLQEDSATLNEVVVIGYGVQAKTKVTNSVSTLKAEDLISSPIASFEEGIAGQLAGVDVVQTSGNPGSNSDINIRGIGTLTANSQPLIVVDGFPSENFNISSINSSDIDRIDVLKDAASASIYGSRGSNGVILVTTKKGKKGVVKFTFDGFTGFQEVSKTLDMQDAYERARFVAVATKNRGKAPLALYQPYLIGIPGLTNTDWQDEIFRIAPMQSSSITASGGTNRMDYFVSGGYFGQEGIVLGSKYSRVNFRINLNFDILKNLKAGFNLAPAYSNRDKVSDGDHKGDGVVLTALMANPLFSPYNPDGSLNLSSDMMRSAIDNGQVAVENPVALALLNTDKRTQWDFLGGGFLEYKPVKDITLKSYFGADYSSSDRETFSPNTVGSYNVLVENNQSKAFNSFFERKNCMIENTAIYNKIFNNKHSLKLLIGQSYQTEDMNTTGSNPLTAIITNIDGVITTTFPKFEEKWSLISYLSRINYDYKDKYIFSGSIRRDGSSRFGVNTKWGWFPSVSGAWRITKEDFFKNTIFNELKPRASWGITGNNGIPNYGAISLLDDANYSEFDGLSPSTAPNPNLSWEQTSTLDLGIDISLFKGKLNITADYYNAITDGLLLDVPVPAHSGYSTSLSNIGKVQNSGFEFALNIDKVKLGYVKWSSTFNISTNRNEVLELGPDQDRLLDPFGYHITEVGKPMGSYYTYRKIGIFQNQEQIDNYLANNGTQPEMRIGDYIYADLNGDKEITQDDREISGDFFPDFTYGFSNTFKYKNLSFSFLLQGKQGVEIFNGNSFFIRNLEGWSNGHNDINNYFSATNPNATYAAPGKHSNVYQQSDLFIEDGSYIRLRKISVKYALPEKFLENISIDKMSIYIAATNLFTITNYSGFNPEVSSRNTSFNNRQTTTPGFDYGAYPVAKTIVMGLNLSF